MNNLDFSCIKTNDGIDIVQESTQNIHFGGILVSLFLPDTSWQSQMAKSIGINIGSYFASVAHRTTLDNNNKKILRISIENSLAWLSTYYPNYTISISYGVNNMSITIDTGQGAIIEITT